MPSEPPRPNPAEAELTETCTVRLFSTWPQGSQREEMCFLSSRSLHSDGRAQISIPGSTRWHVTLCKVHTNLSVFREGKAGRELAPSAPPFAVTTRASSWHLQKPRPSCFSPPGPAFLLSCTQRFSAAAKSCPWSLGWKLYINEVNQAPALPTGM